MQLNRFWFHRRFEQTPPRVKVLLMRLLLICLLILSGRASAQIMLRINDAPPVNISATDLAKLPRHTAVLNVHGKQVSYQGALMHDVLALGGIDFGKGLRGKQLSTYVAALAGDGYEVVFALAEFDPTVTDSGIILADKREGQSLASDEGPLRIVVPHDERPTRSLRLLREIDIVQVKK